MPKLQEKPSALKIEHPVLKNMKILDFFLFLWLIFALLDPDPFPATQINADPCGSGSETLIEIDADFNLQIFTCVKWLRYRYYKNQIQFSQMFRKRAFIQNIVARRTLHSTIPLRQLHSAWACPVLLT
jgi:hypothetical protein